MTLLETWRNLAYQQQQDQYQMQMFWNAYFEEETKVYKELLRNTDEVYEGSVKELSEKFGLELLTFVGFLDGINDSLISPNPIEEMKEDTVVSLDFDNEKLFKNMVEAKADWLYTLKEWEAIFDEDTRKNMIMEQKRSHTFVADKKVGRNDPCPCGSGKKYKKCCGK